MTPLPNVPRLRKRSSPKLSLQPLEERATPASAVYSALTQTLTVVAAEGDQITVASLNGQPAGYIQVGETQNGDTVFDSTTAGQAVRNLVVKFGNVNSGGIALDAESQIGGRLTIYGARSSQTVSLAGTVGGNVVYSAGAPAAFDVVDIEATSMIGGNLTLGLKDGTNTVRFKSGRVCGNVLVKGGAGDDTVEVTEAGDVTVDGSATFLLGDGNNNFIGKGPGTVASVLHVGSNFTYAGGAGNDKFDLDLAGTALEVGSNAKFTFGTPTVFDANTATFESLRAGRNVTFTGGLGNDSVTMTGALQAKGNVTVNLGAGDNAFDSNQEGIATNSISGQFSYVGGPDGDLVNLDAMIIGKSMAVTLGESNGAAQGVFAGLESPTGVTVYGGVKVTGGSGADGVLFRRTFVGGSMIVQTGAGTDTVALDDLDVTGATLIDLGTGDDTLQVETVTGDGGGSLSNATSFGGIVTVKGGDGNDTVNFSNDSDATTLIQFGGRVVLQGGAGIDTLQNAPENVFKVTNNVSDLETVVGPAIG